MSLNELYKNYHQQVQFINIYIREAHPVDGWWLGNGFMKKLLKLSRSQASTDIYDPTTIEERRAAAGDCIESLKYGVKTYIDDMDDQVSKKYAAWPTRLYMVDTQGIIVYTGGLGPFGFKPGELKRAIQNHLQKEIIS